MCPEIIGTSGLSQNGCESFGGPVYMRKLRTGRTIKFINSSLAIKFPKMHAFSIHSISSREKNLDDEKHVWYWMVRQPRDTTGFELFLQYAVTTLRAYYYAFQDGSVCMYPL